jgi:hypothetical protein
MPDYRVKWEIDITARSPRAAAREALRIQRSISDAVVFIVKAHKKRPQTIDLALAEDDTTP